MQRKAGLFSVSEMYLKNLRPLFFPSCSFNRPKRSLSSQVKELMICRISQQPVTCLRSSLHVSGLSHGLSCWTPCHWANTKRSFWLNPLEIADHYETDTGYTILNLGFKLYPSFSPSHHQCLPQREQLPAMHVWHVVRKKWSVMEKYPYHLARNNSN